MSQIVIIGAGKFAQVLYRHITWVGTDEVVAFCVDAAFVPSEGTMFGKPVVAIDDLARLYPPKQHRVLVALGYQDLNELRAQKYETAKALGYELISYISPRAGVGNWLECGDNCIILDQAIIEPGVRLGNNVVVWSGALIGHHSTIEDHAWVAGQAVLGGSALLGTKSFVGLGAIIGHEVQLGAKTFVGAGAMVTKCQNDKAVFVEKETELFRLDSERFLQISKLV